MLVYCKVDSYEKVLVEFVSELYHYIIFIQENAFENVVCQIIDHIVQGSWVNTPISLLAIYAMNDWQVWWMVHQLCVVISQYMSSCPCLTGKPIFLFNIGWHGVLWILLGVPGESGESGARPASGISIEFEIQSKFAALWVQMCSADQRNFAHVQISLWPAEYVMNKTLQTFIEFQYIYIYIYSTINQTF